MSIVNAAKHFVLNHLGIMPPDITAKELMKLHNVHHKTAHLVLQVGLKREAEGMSLDVHLLNVFHCFRWISDKARKSGQGSMMASREMEQWVPEELWKDVNAIFAG